MNSKFARDQLEKCGWTDGKGLGKSEDGMKDAIKVKIKHDTAGIGHDRAEEFKFHWWDYVYNKAANSIKVNESEDGVGVAKVTDGNNGTISSKRPLSKNLANKAMLYGSFVKGATLDNGTEKAEESSGDSSSEAEDETVPDNKYSCTDESMLKICGGRTAHKAARHGFGLSGKLARLEAQEMARLNEGQGDSSPGQGHEEMSKKKKKKKKRKLSEINNDNDQNDAEDIASSDSGVNTSHKPKKQKKKKKNRSEKSESHDATTLQTAESEKSQDIPEEMVAKKKKKKKSKTNEVESRDLADIDVSDLGSSHSKKHKKKKRRNHSD